MEEKKTKSLEIPKLTRETSKDYYTGEFKIDKYTKKEIKNYNRKYDRKIKK